MTQVKVSVEMLKIIQLTFFIRDLRSCDENLHTKSDIIQKGSGFFQTWCFLKKNKKTTKFFKKK